ncbi:membrane protein insertion efficiency factor YidD [Micromonospora sp. WMMD882]|uniref:membrane protein insertion efficiency factor YidD n=1 Tax=Micromonospora sp. WMMD882 TaxID=3015151 RepID=UPI00248D08FC|nr:membrane protein insertion efficiency factor YidD [Micromonospora sp. WMMD882]WBB79562.1 membrane protein insertion efficiency factor YidD [Micromonospora sp. WMMD882]
MIKLTGHGRARRKRKRKSDWGSCDGCDCDGPACCDFGLFSFLLTLGATLAGLVTPPQRHAGPVTRPQRHAGRPAGGSRPGRTPVVDRAGRAAILGYRRWLSAHWPGRCRFTPTCSAYGLTAVERYGLAVGGRLTADRLRRCRPDVPQGTHDPVA